MNTQKKVYTLYVDHDLLEHITHLPETIECHCGYVRAEILATTLVA